MNVVILSTELPPGPGGIGMHAHQLATAGTRSGWTVTMVAPQDYVDDEARAAFAEEVDYEIVRVDRQGSALQRAFTRLRTGRRAIRDKRPDIVLATGERSVWLAALLLGRRHPWVAFGHGAEFGTAVRRRRLATRAALSRCRVAVCNSDYTQAALEQLVGNRVPTEVIPPGADVDRFTVDPASGAAFRREHGLEEVPLIVTIGNVSSRKGQDLVVRALAEPGLEAAHYAVIGLPTNARQVQALADELGVAERVHVLGPLPADDLPRACNAADVFAMTSRHDAAGDFEGYGIAVIEAALCATPSVVTDGSGLTEAVAHGETGVVVPSEDPQAIAQACVELFNDDAHRRTLGANAEQRARHQNDWADLIDRFSAVFDTARGVRSDTVPSGIRLGIVSDTPYYESGDVTVGWGPTVRELDHLSQLVPDIVHVAPRYGGDPPRAALPHEVPGIELRFVEPAGGHSLRSKLGVLSRYPSWIRAIGQVMDECDALHVRCPSNISLLALAVLSVRRRRPPTWVKFAGNWQPDGGEHWSYRLQRVWLRRGVGGAAVTVNGRWADEPDHVVPFHNPTLDADDLARGRAAAIANAFEPPYRLAFVGRLDEAKGAGRALDITLALHRDGVPVELHVVGDGPMGEQMRQRAAAQGQDFVVQFHGWLPRREVEDIYGLAHFLLLPTDSEGFPKVLAEAMAFGAVPLAGAVSSIPRTLGEIGCGQALGPADVDGFASAIQAYLRAPETWQRERDRGVDGAARFSYDRYLEDVLHLFDEHLGEPLRSPSR